MRDSECLREPRGAGTGNQIRDSHIEGPGLFRRGSTSRHQQAVAQEAPLVGAKDECGSRAMPREMEAGMGLSRRYANWSPGARASTLKGDSWMARL
jgi:hypothetical protein